MKGLQGKEDRYCFRKDGKAMEDNKSLNENNELADDQVEDVSGGLFIPPEQPKGKCRRCGEKRVIVAEDLCGPCCSYLTSHGYKIMA